MPWRAKGDERLGTPMPAAPPSDYVAAPRLPGGLPPGEPVATRPDTTDNPATLPEAYDRATRGATACARASTAVLLLFSGPKARPDGLAAHLNRLGFTSTMVDSAPGDGGEEDDLLKDSVYDGLLRRVQAGEFCAILAAPPCSTFSVSRFFTAAGSHNGGPPPVRDRKHVRGLTDVSPSHRRELNEANSLVSRTASLLLAGWGVGTQFIIENPADRGDRAITRNFMNERHAPLWHMPDLKPLTVASGARLTTFPQCAFGSPYQKQTSLLFSPAFDGWLAALSSLKCVHSSHPKQVGGTRDGE